MKKEQHASITMKIAAVEDGKVVKEEYAQSFHGNFVIALGVAMSGLSQTASNRLNDITGVLLQMKATYANHLYSIGAPTANEGIHVGTGSAAIDKTDGALSAKIDNGAGVGQLSYGTMVGQETVVTASGARFILERTFTNNSGADITIEEVGIHSRVNNTGAQVKYILADRTLFTKTVANGASVTIRYTIEAA